MHCRGGGKKGAIMEEFVVDIGKDPHIDGTRGIFKVWVIKGSMLVELSQPPPQTKRYTAMLIIDLPNA